MCGSESEKARRERRVRGFLDVVEEVAKDAARSEVAKAMQPGAMIRVSGPNPPKPTCEFPNCTNWTNLRDGRCDFHREHLHFVAVRVDEPAAETFGKAGGVAAPEDAAAENRRLRAAMDAIMLPGVKHLSADAVTRLRAIRLLLQAGDPKGALAILDDVMGW